MSLSLLGSLLPYWIYANIVIYPVLDDIYFWTISRLFCNSYMSCQCVCLSLTYFPIGHFWGSTSETSGLVFTIFNHSKVATFICLDHLELMILESLLNILVTSELSLWDVYLDFVILIFLEIFLNHFREGFLPRIYVSFFILRKSFW